MRILTIEFLAILEKIVMYDPIGGIEAGQLQKLKDENRHDESALEAKLAVFAKKAIDYYSQKNIKRS